MFGAIPFSVKPISALDISSVKASSVLEAIAILEAEAVAPSASLNAIVTLLANSTLRSSDAEIFIWTTPARPTTWTIPAEAETTWVIPTDVGATTWIIPK